MIYTGKMSLWLCFSTSHPHPCPEWPVLCLPIGLPPWPCFFLGQSRCSFGGFNWFFLSFFSGFYLTVYQQGGISCKAKSRQVRQKNIITSFIVSNKDCLTIKYQGPQISVWVGGSYWENVISMDKVFIYFSHEAFIWKVLGSPSSLAWFHFLLLKE